MILPLDQARRIERGDRTTIRIPVDPRLIVTPLRPARRGHAKPFLPAMGSLLRIAYPQRREDKDGSGTLCHVRLVAVSRGPLGVLSDEQAQAEGYESAGEFVQAWCARHDGEYLDRQVRALVDAAVDPVEAEETREEWAKVRYRDRWQDREVWTLTVRVEHDIDWFLEPASRGRSELGYVKGADPLEAGAVPRDQPGQRWVTRAARKQLEALAATASPEERSRRARALGRRVRALALQDPTLTRRIEELVREAEQDAA